MALSSRARRRGAGSKSSTSWAGRFRPPTDDAVGILLEKGIGCQQAGLAACGEEEIAVDVIANRLHYVTDRCQVNRGHK